MRKQALINVEETDIRIAILEDDTLVELFVEDMHSRSKVGNIYKGRVESIIPGLKAVFINIGCAKNAFLHFADVLPEFDLPQRGRPEREPRDSRRSRPVDRDEELEDDDYIEPVMSNGEDDEDEEPGLKVKRPPRRSRPMRVGDEILVQVTKDEINDKGPRVTTYISLPGRYLVYMPFSDEGGGVSRKIDNIDERRRLRKVLKQIQLEVGSVIVRTAGIDQDGDAIVQDAEMLQETWQGVLRKVGRCRAPARVYDDHDILPRVVRDYFTDDLNEILIDSKKPMRQLIEACQQMVPNLAERIHFYTSPTNIFDTFEVEKQFQKALRRKVWLRSGGALVIDETEAMTAIDVNSGKYVGHEDQDQVILKTNLEACRAIARQLRLRDLGGLVVIDFIDMASRDHEQQVLKEFKRCLRQDRAKFSLTDFSEFGLVQMTRKRVKKSLARSFFRPCPYCDGSGRILSEPQVWKQLKYELIAELEKSRDPRPVQIVVHSEFKSYLQTHVAAALKVLAGKYGLGLSILGKANVHHEHFEIVRQEESGIDGNGRSPEATGRSGRVAAQKKA